LPSSLSCQELFLMLMVRLHFLIIAPPINEEVAAKNSLADWNRDHGGGKGMDFDHFLESMFELVDIWTDSSEESEYLELMGLICAGITVAVAQSKEKRLSWELPEALVPVSSGVVVDGAGAGPNEEGGADGATQRHALWRLRTMEEIMYNP
ncbi:unnamed protein product, partial [Phaeothamnion confervicola]